MEYDLVIVGSGLTALASVLGVPDDCSVCMVSGQGAGLETYGIDNAAQVPLQSHSKGGLGEFWHGVIPLNGRGQFSDVSKETFVELFKIFYPNADIESEIDTDYVFVPNQPIRPAVHYKKLIEDRDGFELIDAMATGIDKGTGGWTVKTADKSIFAKRLFLCAGALQTPSLLGDIVPSEASLQPGDHLIAYLGQVGRADLSTDLFPKVKRKRGGICAGVHPSEDGEVLFSLKPARFDFRKLDEAIETRAAFGLPVGGVIEKIFRSMSLGLISEALYNKLGLFPNASKYSVYGQILCKNAITYVQNEGVKYDAKQTGALIDEAKGKVPFANFIPSQRNDFFVPGIHLHGTLLCSRELDALEEEGLFVADPSRMELRRGEHHTFFQMIKSYSLAQKIFA